MAPKEKRIGTFIILDDQKDTDVEMIKEAFSKHWFNFEQNEEVPYNDLKDLIKVKREGMKKDELHLLYIIAGAENFANLNDASREWTLRSILEDLKGSGARIMIFVQFECQIQQNIGTRGPISSNIKQVDYEQALPHSTNMLLAYIPMLCVKKSDGSPLQNGGESTVDVLCSELGKCTDINTMMAAVTGWAVKNQLPHIPWYSSTMCEQIVLFPQETEGRREESSIVIDGGNAFAFLVEKFDDINNTFEKKKLEIYLPSFIEKNNEDNINSIFKGIGVNVEPPKRGNVTKKELQSKIKEIIDQLKKPTPDVRDKETHLLAIVITSHGNHGGCIYCSDDESNIQDILSEVSVLESVPKLIIVDACRGCGCDKANCDHHVESNDFCKPGGLKLDLPANTLLIMTASEGNAAPEVSYFLKEVRNHVRKLKPMDEVDVFHVIHAATKTVAELKKTMCFPFKSNKELIKVQVTFASSLTKPLRFRRVENVPQDLRSHSV